MIVEMNGVTVRYPRSGFTLTASDFSADRGEMVAICGPSGSGKSTLLDVCAGLTAAESGDVTVLGHDLTTRRGRARIRTQGTYLTQRGSVVDYLTALENVLLAGDIASVKRDHGKARAALEAVGLDGAGSARVASLSGGQRQRVAMASAIYRGSPLVWADEPTSALDATNATLVFEGLRDLAHGTGAAVLCVTHDAERAAAIADRVVSIVDGELREQAAPPVVAGGTDAAAGV